MDLQDRSELEPYIESHVGSKLVPILAEINLQNDMVDDTVNLSQKMITENPKLPYGYYLLALAEIKSDEIANAIEHLKQTIALDNGFLDAYQLLVEIAKDQLSPGALKACYKKITELNPLDENARAEADRISAETDRQALQDITLPEIQTRKVITRREPKVQPASEPQPESQPEIAEDIAASIVPEPEMPEPQSELNEEEAHLGPMILEEDEELEPQLELESETEPLEEISVETDQDTEPEPEPVFEAQVPDLTAPEPEPEPEVAVNKSMPPMPTPPPPSVTETPAEPAKPVSAAPPPAGNTASALSDMFAKLRNKPLEEVQKENWSLPVVEAPVPEKNPKELAEKPNIKFTVPLREKIDPKEKLESIHKEIGLKPMSGGSQPDEKKNESAAAGIVAETEPAAKISPISAALKEAPENEAEANSMDSSAKKIELKIPVPTFTLVEVFKKQKLYDEALQLLDVLERKSKNLDRIESERKELLRLKMEEAES